MGENVVSEPCFVDDMDDIQRQVGGVFDVVTTTMGVDDGKCVVVGYINDEGLVNGLPLNFLATALFQREIHGDVVVVWGLNGSGKYDGSKYDLPTGMMDFLLHDLVTATAEIYNDAQFTKLMVELAVHKGHISPETYIQYQRDMVSALRGEDRERIMELDAQLTAIVEWCNANVSEAEVAKFILGRIAETETEGE